MNIENEEVLTLGTFLAIRGYNDDFYLCRINETINLNRRHNCAITWLERTSNSNEYIIAKDSTIQTSTFLCEVKLQKITRFKYQIQNEEIAVVQSILKRILDEEKNADCNIINEMNENYENPNRTVSRSPEKETQVENEFTRNYDEHPKNGNNETCNIMQPSSIMEITSREQIVTEAFNENINSNVSDSDQQEKLLSHTDNEITIIPENENINSEVSDSDQQGKLLSYTDNEITIIPENENINIEVSDSDQQGKLLSYIDNEITKIPENENINSDVSDSDQQGKLLSHTDNEITIIPENENIFQKLVYTTDAAISLDEEGTKKILKNQVDVTCKENNIITPSSSVVIPNKRNGSDNLSDSELIDETENDDESDHLFADSGSEYRPSDEEITHHRKGIKNLLIDRNKKECYQKRDSIKNKISSSSSGALSSSDDERPSYTSTMSFDKFSNSQNITLLTEDGYNMKSKNINVRRISEEDININKVNSIQISTKALQNIDNSVGHQDFRECKNKTQKVSKSDKKISVKVNKIKVSFSTKQDDNKRIYDKRHACYFCHQLYIKISRHLESCHKDELEVAKILAKDKKSAERKKGFLLLTRVGDFYHNAEVLASGKGELILARRPNEEERGHILPHKFGPCPYCLGFFLKKHLYLHTKKCDAKKAQDGELKSSVVMESNSLINSFLSVNVNPLFKQNIIDSFKNDEISNECKRDETIVTFGKMLYEKHGNTQNELIRQSMRQLGRLLIELKNNNPNQDSLKNFLLPERFEEIISAVKTLCGAETKKRQRTEYGTPSLAMKIGYSLRKCVGVLRSGALKKGNLQYHQELKNFLDILDIEWSTRISSNAIATLNCKKINAVNLLPLTSDLLKLNKYIDCDMEIYKILLKNNRGEKDAWYRLAQVALSRIILFNKRRGGEVSKMMLRHYTSNVDWNSESTQELKNSLTPLEKRLSENLKLIQIPGKRGRTVPVLLTQKVCEVVELLIETRKDVGISPSNEYVFARVYNSSEGYLRGPDCLRAIATRANLESPSTVTSTKLRKYIATVSQVFNLKEHEMDWLARHLGHDIRVHRDFYRMHDSAIELTKISRLLMAVDEGKASNFYGKGLADININDLPEIEEQLPSDHEIEDNTQTFNTTHEAGTSTAETNNNKNLDFDYDSDNQTDESIPQQNIKRRKIIKRQPWSSEESSAVLKFFRVEIKKGIVPGKKRCEECKTEAANLLKERSWKDIKYHIYNHIQKCKRR